MTALSEILRRRIAAEGPVTVAEFMSTALIHPDHGYYTQHDPFGAAGDFITAPEISQMFGELIGFWCAATWQQTGAPTNVRLVELGPGRGTLMADALRAIRMVPAFEEAATIHLVEASPVLKAHQKQALQEYSVIWHRGIEEVPDGPLILIANEFLDALPIRQIIRRQGVWHERMIGNDGDGFSFVLDKAPSALGALLPDELSQNAAEGALVEMGSAALGLAKAVGDRIASHGGGALFIDYGHAETAVGETLQAVRKHQSVDVLARPGEADITAHVDFDAFGRAAEQRVSVYGPIEQGEFLRRLGIEARMEKLSANASAEGRAKIESAYRRLTEADQMGQLFKAMALIQHGSAVPAGFET